MDVTNKRVKSLVVLGVIQIVIGLLAGLFGGLGLSARRSQPMNHKQLVGVRNETESENEYAARKKKVNRLLLEVVSNRKREVGKIYALAGGYILFGFLIIMRGVASKKQIHSE